MTVNYMKMLQRGQSMVAMATELQYNCDYQSCARQALRCLSDDIFSTDKSQSTDTIISKADDTTRMREKIQFAIPEMQFRTTTQKRVYQVSNDHTSQYPGVLQYTGVKRRLDDKIDFPDPYKSSSSFNERIEEEHETAVDKTSVTGVTYSYIKHEFGVQSCTKGETNVWRPW